MEFALILNRPKKANALISLIGLVATLSGLYGIVFIIEYKIFSDIIFLAGLYLLWFGGYLRRLRQ